MKIHLTNNFFYKVISLLLAILLWLYVSHQENPLTEQVFSVPLEIRGLEKNLVVTDKPDTVKVRIQGKRQDVSEVTSKEVIAYVDMAGVDVGQYPRDIYVTLPSKTQMVSVNPSKVEISVDVVDSIQAPVSVEFTENTLAPGFMSLSPVLTPSLVVISGSGDKLDDVSRVFVEVDLTNAKTNYHERLPVKVEDKWGNLLQDWVEVSPTDVEVVVPVVNELPRKVLPLEIPLSGKPAAGYKVTRIVSEPAVLTAYGDFNELEQIHSLSTTIIDVANATQDSIKTVDVVVPEGINLLEETKITIIVKIEKVQQKAFNGLPITLHNIPKGLEIVSQWENANVVVEAADDMIEKLTTKDIQIYIDLANLKAGEHRVPVRVKLPTNVSLAGIKPGEVLVKLE